MDKEKQLKLVKGKMYTRHQIMTHIFEGHSLAQIMVKTNYLYPTAAMYKSRWLAGGITQKLMDTIIKRWGFVREEYTPHQLSVMNCIDEWRKLPKDKRDSMEVAMLILIDAWNAERPKGGLKFKLK